MSIPRDPSRRPTVVLWTRISPELREQLDTLVNDSGSTLSYVVNLCIRDGIEQTKRRLL